MSEYASPFVKSFISRTNHAIQNYDGNYDATILLNGLLGMLIIPFEKHPDIFENYSVSSEIMQLFAELNEDGRYKTFGHRYLAYDIIRNLRNSIAHFNVDDISENGEVWGFVFSSYEVNKVCPTTGEECVHKNEFVRNARKKFYVKMSLTEIKQLANIINEYVAMM